MVAGSNPAGPTSAASRWAPRRCEIGRRIERRIRAKDAKVKPLRWLVAGGLVVVALVGAVALSARWRAEHRVTVGEAPPATVGVAVASESVEASSVVAGRVEVPNLVGMTLDEAKALLGTGGLSIRALASPAGETTPGVVLDQDPAPGTIVGRGGTVSVWYASAEAVVATSAPNDPDAARGGRFVVCIDPGHQDKPNLAREPIGPGAAETVPKCAAGVTGVVTGQSEAVVALAIALELKRALEERGVTVVLTRTTNAVDIPNAERARIANECGADLFVRIHAGSDTNGDVSGVRTLYPAGNEWVAPISSASRAAAQAIQRALADATGAQDRGTASVSDLAGFNWSRVPAVLVECGYLTNPVEDRRLATEAYRSAVARGICAGVLQYLED
ncbi:MAG: N-acetylmuramoyl-L-alanine amidase [Anaerosomatales bacterium]|nr:N-acetylmuramoyl-L-alanine amidase [Anaerosomatales bacterium]